MSRIVDVEPLDCLAWKDGEHGTTFDDGVLWVLEKIGELPAIQPERWIPCSERLPEESGLYIVTNVGRWVEPVGTRYYNIRADGGFWSGHPGNTVVAWMPLPEPYKEETE